MNPLQQQKALQTRRQFFRRGALGLGGAALATLLNESAFAGTPDLKTDLSTNPGGIAGLPHHQPKAKRAIYLFMSGAPSQLDMYDYKPQMTELYDTDLPDEIRMG